MGADYEEKRLQLVSGCNPMIVSIKYQVYEYPSISPLSGDKNIVSLDAVFNAAFFLCYQVLVKLQWQELDNIPDMRIGVSLNALTRHRKRDGIGDIFETEKWFQNVSC